VGSLLGQTLDVDMLALRRRAHVRILVGMVDTLAFKDEFGEYTSFSLNLVVKLKGFEFTFTMEKITMSQKRISSLLCGRSQMMSQMTVAAKHKGIMVWVLIRDLRVLLLGRLRPRSSFSMEARLL
jgi:hypothetical protein